MPGSAAALAAASEKARRAIRGSRRVIAATYHGDGLCDYPRPVPSLPGDPAARRTLIDQAFSDLVPHKRALGVCCVDVGPTWAVLRLPWDARLVGNTERNVLHGGVI